MIESELHDPLRPKSVEQPTDETKQLQSNASERAEDEEDGEGGQNDEGQVLMVPRKYIILNY